MNEDKFSHIFKNESQFLCTHIKQLTRLRLLTIPQSETEMEMLIHSWRLITVISSLQSKSAPHLWQTFQKPQQTVPTTPHWLLQS